MFQLEIPVSPESWNEATEEFIPAKTVTLQLEHSLVSLSKWESKWNKPFLSNTTNMTSEESLDYIRCMTITKNVDPKLYLNLTTANVEAVINYINAPMTATTCSEDKDGKKNREIVTAELIYYWMISFNIPVKFEKWHLNRLLTLIRVCNIKNSPPKKQNKRDMMAKRAALNAERRAQLHSKG